jgi:hypothetical protein
MTLVEYLKLEPQSAGVRFLVPEVGSEGWEADLEAALLVGQ